MDEELISIDIPQADNVSLIRAVTELVGKGVGNVHGLASRLGVTPRHATYCQNAARILGWIELRDDQLLLDAGVAGAPKFVSPSSSARPRVTELGTQLLQSEPGSPDERSIVYRSILGSASLTRVLGPSPGAMTSDAIVARIRALTGLSDSTAERRARSIQAWLQYAGATDPSKTRDLNPNSEAYLTRYLEHARFTLILDWSFASFARNRDGSCLAHGQALVEQLDSELRALSDPSLSFIEFLSLARTTAGSKLRTELARLLTAASAPSSYGVWFNGPWQRIYYLGIDTIPLEMRTQDLQRTLALSSPAARTSGRPGDLQLVQLHGDVSNGLQLEREERSPTWDALTVDVLAHPLLVVTNAELSPEAVRILDIRRNREHLVSRELRPKCFVIAPSLSRGREALLRDQNIHWVQANSDMFGERLVSTYGQSLSAGIAFAKRQAAALVSTADNVTRMADVVAKPPTNKTNYLLGHEPQWSDIASGRAIPRCFDEELTTALRVNVKLGGRLSIVTGTAGSGKSTALMRAAYQLAQDGHSTAYVAADAEVSLGQLRESATAFDALFIDDVDRYGRDWPSFAAEFLSLGARLVCVALRSTRVDTFRIEQALKQGHWTQHALPWLTDADIRKLLVVLEKEHRLGRLKGMSLNERISCFEQRADRQLLVAMIEATSGRRFDEKIESEWEELGERAQLFYALVCISSTMRYSLTRRELMLAISGDRSPADLSAFEELVRSNVLGEDTRGRIRARHRVIADKLVERIGKKTKLLCECLEGLAYAIAVDLAPNDESWRSRRFLRAILNHDYLQRVVEADGARRIYSSVESLLHWDYHYWLQRGSVEVEDGDIRLAEQFLEQAFSINSRDRQVITAYAYMLMKKAASQATAVDAEEWLEQGKSLLLDQISSPTRVDEYPYHVLGTGVLRWIRRASWPLEKKKKLLRESLRVIQAGTKTMPRSHVLTQLETDMRKRLLELDVL